MTSDDDDERVVTDLLNDRWTVGCLDGMIRVHGHSDLAVRPFDQRLHASPLLLPLLLERWKL